MDLLSIVKARSIWLFDSLDLNPRGKSIGQELIDWVKESYSFERAPKSTQDLDESKALAFGGGQFQVREEIFIDVDLKIYNDGVIADTRSSTTDSDLFLNDLLSTEAREFNLPYKPNMVRKKLYYSELNLRTGKRLDDINPKLKKISERLTILTGIKEPFVVGGITFNWDPELNLGLSGFRFDRRLTLPFSENRYWSCAPLQTEDHLSLLDDLETILSP